MLTTTDVIEIMRLAGAVHESGKHPLNQPVDSFKPVAESHDTKRYLHFMADNQHSKYLTALYERLQKLGNGDAVMKLRVNKVGDDLTFSDKDGFMAAIVLDTNKITDMAEKNILSELIANTMIKMDHHKLDIEVRNLTSNVHKLKEQLAATTAVADENKAASNKMKAGIKKIKDASAQTKASLASRKVNALKQVINQVAQSTK